MPAIALHPPQRTADASNASNPLPTLLQTPSGLAILEIQGTIHAPEASANDSSDLQTTPIGNLVFPLYSHHDPDDKAWMKRVYLYVGKHQRMTGEVKKLPKPLGVIRKKEHVQQTSAGQDSAEELECVEIVHYKIVFSQRQEPVSEEL